MQIVAILALVLEVSSFAIVAKHTQNKCHVWWSRNVQLSVIGVCIVFNAMYFAWTPFIAMVGGVIVAHALVYWPRWEADRTLHAHGMHNTAVSEQRQQHLRF